MKKLLALVLAALMIFAMAACTPAEPNGGDNESGDNQQVDSDAKVVKIGIFEPASGDNGAGGKQETLGIQYANSIQNTVEIGGETYEVQLVSVDNESSNDKAPTAASTLISQGC